jgi:hypothetical protein
VWDFVLAEEEKIYFANFSKKKKLEILHYFSVDFKGEVLCISAFRMQRNCTISVILFSVSAYNFFAPISVHGHHKHPYKGSSFC